MVKTARFGMGGHEGPMLKDEWLTPPEIIKALGDFDLDPCSPINRPWPTAKKHFTIEDDGLQQQWFGRVWVNPPYGKHTSTWMSRLVEHGNGIALIFSRTETNVWFDYIWERATAVLFIKGRLRFRHVSGNKSGNAGAPSALIAYGDANAESLRASGIIGRIVIP